MNTRMVCVWMMFGAACGPRIEDASNDDAAASSSVNDPGASESTNVVSGSAADSESDSGSGSDPVSVPDPDPAWPECPFESGVAIVDPESPYPFCQQDGPSAYELYCDRQPNGHGYWNWHVHPGGQTSEFCGDVECNACACMVSCRDQGEELIPCPQPTSGTAQPACFKWNGPESTGQCLLDCGNGEACPDGMQCVHNLEAAMFVCAWMTTGDR